MRITNSVLLALICALIVLPLALYAAALNADQALSVVEQALLPEGKDQVIIKVWGPVSAGTEIRGTKELALVAPTPGFAFFIDDYPAANLFHSVRYAFVEAETGKLTAVNAISPPENYQDYQMIPTAIGEQLMAAVNRRPTPTKEHDPPPTRSDRWAVLMNGGYDSGNNHVRYWNDISNIYMALTETYAFADDHIIVLCSDGLDPTPDQSNGQNSNPDLDGDGDADIMYPCLLNNVNAVFAGLASLITPGDKLFVFTTDHGSTAGGWNTIENLWNHEELTDAHFASLLAALPACEIICTLEPCYSGGFLDDIVVPPGPRVASSACAYDQVSWAMPPDYVYDTYVFQWTAAVKGEDAYGNPVNADYNGDGLITMDEAYRYAELHDISSEDPQYDDEPVGIGAGISLWPTSSGPFLVVSQTLLDDIGGNNNGAPDPGETISLLVTLNNVGTGTASNIVGTLSSTDPYLAVTQNSASYPDLGHFEQGQGSPAYILDISGTCPMGTIVTCNLHIAADSAYTNDVVISFEVGNILYSPMGPDAYGYYGYDILDQPEGPEYAWIEVAPLAGGPGSELTALTNRDDASVVVSLPFTFQYYGLDYTQLTICTNGWVALGSALPDSDWSNSAIPNADGPPCMLAPFWEDMNLESGNGQIATYDDAANHWFVIEYYHVPQFSPATAVETFEVILYDPAFYTTPTGDGKILFQYHTVSDPSSCTMGIENSDETIGLQYLFDTTYDLHNAQIADSSAILFATSSAVPAPDVVVVLTPASLPIEIPAIGGSFDFNIAVTNNESTGQTFDCWLDATLPDGSSFGPVLGPVELTLPAGASIARDRTQNVPGSAPAGVYSYNAYVGVHPSIVWSSDAFGFTKLGSAAGLGFDQWSNWGEAFGKSSANSAISGDATPEAFALYGAFPNPFNPQTTISYALPQASAVKLTVCDLSGRTVSVLTEGWQTAGVHEVTFEAAKLASGMYLIRLQSGSQEAIQKMILLK